MDNVYNLFDGQFLLVQQADVRNFVNCKHKSETPIKNHMLNVIGYLAEAQIQKSEINADNQREMIF